MKVRLLKQRVTTVTGDGREIQLNNVSDEDLRYYIDKIHGDFYMRLLVREKIFLFGDDGIPTVKYTLTDGRYHHNPATVCIWGLDNLNKYIKHGKHENLAYVRNCAKWLSNNLEEASYGGFVWRYHMDWLHNLKSGFISGMAQGLAISLLLRSAALFKKHEYLELAEEAFNPMIVPVENGGVAIVKDDFYWIEEAPSKSPTLVLNGFIYALFGVYDLYRFTGKEAYKKWFDRGIRTLITMLPRYDLGIWSRYDLGLKVVRSKTNVLLEKVLSPSEMHNIATPSYNRLHVEQLKKLYEITGLAQFRYYSRRWSINPLKYTQYLTYLLATL